MASHRSVGPSRRHRMYKAECPALVRSRDNGHLRDKVELAAGGGSKTAAEPDDRVIVTSVTQRGGHGPFQNDEQTM